MNIISMLRRCEVFIGLNDNDLRKVAELLSWRREKYEKGDSIFLENSIAMDFYILEDGQVQLFVKVNGQEPGVKQVGVDTITRGDVFGWSSLVSPHLLTMSALCVKPSSVLMVDGSELVSLMDSNHTLGYEIMKGLVRVIGIRLRDIRGRFVGKSSEQSCITRDSRIE